MNRNEQDIENQALNSIQTCLETANQLIHLELQNFSHNTAYSGETNKSGDLVSHIDIVADEIVAKCLSTCKHVAGFASEERENFVSFIVDDGDDENGGERDYIVVYDPLDGSQNLPVSLSVGAIYGIFKGKQKENTFRPSTYLYQVVARVLLTPTYIHTYTNIYKYI